MAQIDEWNSESTVCVNLHGPLSHKQIGRFLWSVFKRELCILDDACCFSKLLSVIVIIGSLCLEQMCSRPTSQKKGYEPMA